MQEFIDQLKSIYWKRNELERAQQGLERDLEKRITKDLQQRYVGEVFFSDETNLWYAIIKIKAQIDMGYESITVLCEDEDTQQKMCKNAVEISTTSVATINANDLSPYFKRKRREILKQFEDEDSTWQYHPTLIERRYYRTSLDSAGLSNLNLKL